ncbi:hypothetical protein HF895_15930 [Bacteroides sp. AN502]|nr:hypothetical protein [Caecibacteroides pullorum]MDC6281729.1 hypothetical protein [Caecibacteroides pullorum]
MGGLLGVLGINLKVSDKSGAGLAEGSIGGIVLAVDEDNPLSLLLYAYSYQRGTNATAIQISSNNLSVGVTNSVGTMTVKGGTNIVQYRLGFPK